MARKSSHVAEPRSARLDPDRTTPRRQAARRSVLRSRLGVHDAILRGSIDDAVADPDEIAPLAPRRRVDERIAALRRAAEVTAVGRADDQRHGAGQRLLELYAEVIEDRAQLERVARLRVDA